MLIEEGSKAHRSDTPTIVSKSKVVLFWTWIIGSLALWTRLSEGKPLLTAAEFSLLTAAELLTAVTWSVSPILALASAHEFSLSTAVEFCLAASIPNSGIWVSDYLATSNFRVPELCLTASDFRISEVSLAADISVSESEIGLAAESGLESA